MVMLAVGPPPFEVMSGGVPGGVGPGTLPTMKLVAPLSSSISAPVLGSGAPTEFSPMTLSTICVPVTPAASVMPLPVLPLM